MDKLGEQVSQTLQVTLVVCTRPPSPSLLVTPWKGGRGKKILSVANRGGNFPTSA